MRTKLFACCAVLGLGAALFNCSSSSDDKSDGGSGGEASGGKGGSGSGGKGGSGGQGGAKSGGSGGTSSGGSGGSATGGGGSGSGGSGSGGSSEGGAGGVAAGGSGGMAMGGSGGTVSGACVGSLPGAKKIAFESAGDLWVNSTIEGRVTSSVAPMLSSVQKHGDTGMSMALSINTADGTAAADKSWFYGVSNVSTLFPYMEAGRTISFWVWIPADTKIGQASVVLRSITSALPADGQWQSQIFRYSIQLGAWSQVSFPIPAVYDCSKATPNGLNELGIFIQVPGTETYNGLIYVDDFEISAKP